jgi:hypothetical protein
MEEVLTSPSDGGNHKMSTRERLSAVYSLLEAHNSIQGDHVQDHISASTFWSKVHSHVQDETDAWLRAALLGRQAITACSPFCKTSDQVNFIAGLADQTSDMETYVSAAVFGAMRQLLKVKPGLVMPRIQGTANAFMGHLRQSENLLEERKQHEELLHILIDFLIANGKYAEAESICIEFMEGDAIGIRAVAMEGLLSLVSSTDHLLQLRILDTAWKLMMEEPTVEGRLAGVRLFRVVTTQHAQVMWNGMLVLEKAIHGCILVAHDRSAVVRREVALSFRYLSASAKETYFAQLVMKTPLDEFKMRHNRSWDLAGNGVLLTLLEDSDPEV